MTADADASGRGLPPGTRLNALGQPVGPALPGFMPRPRPQRLVHEGRFVRLEPVEPARHAASFFAAQALDAAGANWTYLAAEPPADLAAARAYLEAAAGPDDPLMFAVAEAGSGAAVGHLSLMRCEPAHGVIEIGNINFTPRLQRTPGATEAVFLAMRHVFADLGYRRFEWKCDSLNAPSRRAAVRFGFSYEGLFRQAVVTKGRSRDTAWYSMLDSEWPAIAAAFIRWLAPDNFDADGRQRQSLAALVAGRTGSAGG